MAVAAVISQTAAAVIVILILIRSEDVCRLEWKKLKIRKEKLLGMLKIGVLAGMQGAAFSVSNLLIQSSVNSLGTAVMAASAISLNIDHFCFVAIDVLGRAVFSFSGQSYRAGIRKRVDNILWYSLGVGCILGILAGGAAIVFASTILGIYTQDAEVIRYGKEIMLILCVSNLLTVPGTSLSTSCGVWDIPCFPSSARFYVYVGCGLCGFTACSGGFPP